MKTIRDPIADPGGPLTGEDLGRTMRMYSMLGKAIDAMAPKRLDGGPKGKISADFARSMLKAEPSAWRAVAQMTGVFCAHAENGVEGFANMTGSAQSLVAEEHWEEFKRVAHDCATLEALRAWQWLARDSWDKAHGQLPWLELTDKWLARRTDEALAELDGYATFCIAELSASASHDALSAAVVGGINVGGIDTVPETHRDRVARLVRDKLAELGSLMSDAASIDEAFLSLLERIGPEGVKHAEAIRKDLPEKIKEHGTASYGWLPSVNPVSPPRRLTVLAVAIWHDVVEPELKRDEARRPGIVRATYSGRLLQAMTKQVEIPELDDGTVRDDKGRILARISYTTDTTLEAVRRGAYALGTVAGHRLIRALILRSHAAWNRGDNNPCRVAFEGGWGGLLEALGASRDQHSLAKDIARAGQCIVWETPHVRHGGLWTWSERRGTKVARGEVAFTLGDALAPGAAEDAARTGGNSQQARIARRLVPELRYEPPMGGARERDHGPIWTFHRLMLLELVDHAEKLAEDGSVVITDARWRELAKTAGAATSIVDRTLAAWVEGENEKAPALLERAGKDAWTLAKPHEPGRDFIIAGGAKRAKGRAAARKQPRGDRKP
jgi:hypothetical protein